jgi:hypothetical protein
VFFALAVEPKMSMLLEFSFETEPTDVLKSDPLGVVNEQAALAHYGSPVRKPVLPNGNQGWLYETGEKINVPGLYISEIPNDGIVIDVLHKGYHYDGGHSALRYQYLEGAEVASRTLTSRPGE